MVRIQKVFEIWSNKIGPSEEGWTAIGHCMQNVVAAIHGIFLLFFSPLVTFLNWRKKIRFEMNKNFGDTPPPCFSKRKVLRIAWNGENFGQKMFETISVGVDGGPSRVPRVGKHRRTEPPRVPAESFEKSKILFEITFYNFPYLIVGMNPHLTSRIHYNFRNLNNFLIILRSPDLILCS